MFAHAAQAMGYFTAVLDPDATSPAGRISHQHIRSGYSDAHGLAELARVCAAITTEFENVPAASLNRLAQTLPVAPAGSARGHCPRPRCRRRPTLCAAACPWRRTP